MRFVLSALVLLCFCTTALAQIGSTVYTDKENHFSVKPAPQWSRASSELLGAIDEMGYDTNPYRTCSVTAAWTRSSSAKVVYPFLVVDVTPREVSSMSFADIEKGFDAQTRPDKATALGQPFMQMIKQLGEKEPVLDRQRKRIITKETGTDDEKIPFTELSVGFLGQTCAVHLTLVCDSRQLDLYVPEFQKFVDNFAWDAGFQYTEPPAGKGNADGWTANRTQAQVDAAAAAEAAASKKSSRRSSGSGVRVGFGSIRMLGGCGIGVLLLMGAAIKWMWRD